MKTTRLIGLKCKCGDVFSLQVLIGRGLDLKGFMLPKLCYSILKIQDVITLRVSLRVSLKDYIITIYLQQYQVGDYRDEVTPVPMPNTEVKLIFAENTRLATARKHRSSPTLHIPL